MQVVDHLEVGGAEPWCVDLRDNQGQIRKHISPHRLSVDYRPFWLQAEVELAVPGGYTFCTRIMLENRVLTELNTGLVLTTLHQARETTYYERGEAVL